MPKTKYKRILLKLSGEVLSGKLGYGIDPNLIQEIALKINLKFIIFPPILIKHKHIKLFYTSDKITEIIANLLIKA